MALFGDDRFEFAEWHTPFENADLLVLEIAYAPELALAESEPECFDASLFRQRDSKALTIRLYDNATAKIYRVRFASVWAFRVLEDHGLMEIWAETKKRGGRPAHATFLIRNHLWTKESPFTFVHSDGWSYMIATQEDCVEIVSAQPPDIFEEPSAH